jgi:hypothetical protein
VFCVFQNRIPGVAENSHQFSGRLYRLSGCTGRDFHGFLLGS